MELVNKNVKMLDPFSQSLTQEQKELILEECKVNPQYFFEQILGVKANRLTWELIRQMPNYPKDTPGDHDGDMLPYSVENPHPEAGKHYEDGSMRMADGRRFGPIVEWPMQISEPGIAITCRPEPSAADIEIGNRNWTQNQLANKAAHAWNLTCKNFDHQEDGVTNEKVIEMFALMINQYDIDEHEMRLDSLVWNEQYPSLWKATPGFAYRKIGIGDWLRLDYTPSVRVPSTAFGVEQMSTTELRNHATLAWNEVVKSCGGKLLITESQLECIFDKELGNAIGFNRVKVKVEAGEPSFSYRVEKEWLPL
jgi:hypothetical protein